MKDPEQNGKDAQIARTLTALANRCEDEEPSHTLNRAISLVVWGGNKPTWPRAPMRSYTQRVDAANILMPEGWRIQEISQCPSAAGIPGWAVFAQSDEDDLVGGWAETEAPARCAAALNARACSAAYEAAQDERRYQLPPAPELDTSHEPDDDIPF